MAKYISRAAIAAAALALGVSGAYAIPYGTGDLHVSVNVVTSCSISSVGAIEFTEIAASAQTTEEIKSSAIVVSCNNGGWKLSPSQEIDGDVRSMTHTNGGASLNYKLCNPIPGSYIGCQPFRTGAPFTGSALNDTKTIYAVIEGGKLPTKSGTYSDIVTIQLTN